MVTRQKVDELPEQEGKTDLYAVPDSDSEEFAPTTDDLQERIRLAGPFGQATQNLLALHQASRIADLPTRNFENGAQNGTGVETLSVLFMADKADPERGITSAVTELAYLDDGIIRLNRIRFDRSDGSYETVPVIHPYDKTAPTPEETERAISAMEVVYHAAMNPALNPDLASLTGI